MSARADETRRMPPRDAYRLWAPCYRDETAVSALERKGTDRVTPALAGRTLLDAGCGTGRRSDQVADAGLVVGVDLVVEMIRAGAAPGGTITSMMRGAADVRALPLRDRIFDVLWCRLVLGHVPDIAPAYLELGRVAAHGARLVVTDFHPAADAAGHTRSFRDERGHLHTIQHHVHSAEQHVDSARRAGWHIREHEDLRVGTGIRSFYEDAGALDRYDAQLGMPLVLLLVFER